MENEQTSKSKSIKMEIIVWLVAIPLAIGYLVIRESGLLSLPSLTVEDDCAFAKVRVNVSYGGRHSKTTVNLMLIPFYYAGDVHQLWLVMPARDWLTQQGDSVFLIGDEHRKISLCARWNTRQDNVSSLACPLTPEQWEELKDFPLQKVIVSCPQTHKTWDCQRFAGRNLGNAIKKIEQVKSKVNVSTLHYKASSSKEKYVGETKNGIPHGHGKIYYKNGEIFEGEFEDGQRNGPGKLTYPTGEVTEGHWVNGIKAN